MAGTTLAIYTGGETTADETAVTAIINGSNAALKYE